MIKITISAPEKQKTVIVSDKKSLRELLTEEKVNGVRARILLDGMPVSADDMNKPLWKLVRTDNCSLCIKQMEKPGAGDYQERVNVLMSEIEKYQRLLDETHNTLNIAEQELTAALEESRAKEATQKANHQEEL